VTVYKVIGSLRNQPVLINRGKAFHLASLAAVAVVALMFASSNCMAQESTSIAPDQFLSAMGIVVFNQAAGIGNQEMNDTLVTDVSGRIDVNQESVGVLLPFSNVKATIGASVGANATGVIEITQVSGAGNELANAAFIGISTDAQPLNPISLSQARAAGSPIITSVPFQGQATMSPSAFANASGVVQVDQVAGNNNLASNIVALHVIP
jgi:hypothetical protein